MYGPMEEYLEGGLYTGLIEWKQNEFNCGALDLATADSVELLEKWERADDVIVPQNVTKWIDDVSVEDLLPLPPELVFASAVEDKACFDHAYCSAVDKVPSDTPRPLTPDEEKKIKNRVSAAKYRQKRREADENLSLIARRLRSRNKRLTRRADAMQADVEAMLALASHCHVQSFVQAKLLRKLKSSLAKL